MKPTLLVLAAGMGSRYGGLKQIDPVGPGGETMLDYSVFDALRAGFGRVVFLIRKDIEDAFKTTVGARYAGRVETGYAFQELGMVPAGFRVPAERQKPWGTAHAMLCAESAVHGPFAAINADDFYGADSYRSMAAFLARPEATDGVADYAMVGFHLRKTLSEHGSVARGICKLSARGTLDHVEEMTKIERTPAGARNVENGVTTELTGDEVVSMNLWGFQPSIFPHLRRLFADFLKRQGQELKSEFFIPLVASTLIAEKKARFHVLPTQSTWFGITYREDKPVVMASIRALIAKGDYPAQLWT